MATSTAARLRVAEAALPRAQRVRADAEKLGRRVCSDAAQRTPLVRRGLHCFLKTPAYGKGWSGSFSYERTSRAAGGTAQHGGRPVTRQRGPGTAALPPRGVPPAAPPRS